MENKKSKKRNDEGIKGLWVDLDLSAFGLKILVLDLFKIIQFFYNIKQE